MKKYNIRLRRLDDVQEFVEGASRCSFDINIFYNHIIIDAKSILGILGMDLTQPLTVETYGENREFEKLVNKFQTA